MRKERDVVQQVGRISEGKERDGVQQGGGVSVGKETDGVQQFSRGKKR